MLIQSSDHFTEIPHRRVVLRSPDYDRVLLDVCVIYSSPAIVVRAPENAPENADLQSWKRNKCKYEIQNFPIEASQWSP